LLWVSAGFAAYPTFIALRQCVHPRPRFRFDTDGFACSEGCIGWHEVERLELYERVRGDYTDHWIFFRVPQGTPRHASDSSAYFKGWPLLGRPRWTSTGLIVPFWRLRPEKCLETLRRVYPGLVGKPRTLTRADIRDLKRREEWPWARTTFSRPWAS
jgi:hypothetical protein